MLEKINLKRANPKRSKKRKLMQSDIAPLYIRIPRALKETLKKEAGFFGISESLYINAVIQTRDQSKIKQIFRN